MLFSRASGSTGGSFESFESFSVFLAPVVRAFSPKVIPFPLAAEGVGSFESCFGSFESVGYSVHSFALFAKSFLVTVEVLGVEDQPTNQRRRKVVPGPTRG